MLDTMPKERPAAPSVSGPVETPDLDLMLKKVAQGSRSDLKGIYNATGPRLFAVLIRMLGNRGIAEDLLQETFVSVWRKAYQFDPSRGNAMAWLYSITRRKAIDRLRMSNREVVGVLEDVASSDNQSDYPIDPVDAETRISIQRSLQTLKPDHQRAIRLCYAYGFTHEELAVHLNIPLGTAKSWVKRGLQQLKFSMTNRGNTQEAVGFDNQLNYNEAREA